MKICRNLTGAILLVLCAIHFAAAQKTAPTKADVVYVPTGEKIVDAMLDLARVGANDLVYDLGCGDGRIVIEAAKRFGAKGVGIEIDSELIKQATENARQAKVENLVKFLEADIFKTNFKRATVVMLYLSPSVNLRLRPLLLKQLKPGTRIVSHDFSLGDWQPNKPSRLTKRRFIYGQFRRKNENRREKLTVEGRG